MSEVLRNDEWERLTKAQDETHLIRVDRQAGVVRMCDVVTGESLKGGEVLPSMLEDALYKKGFESFQELTQKYDATIELILNNHDGEADAVRLLEDHGAILENATLACIEMNTSRSDAHELPLAEALACDLDDSNGPLVEYAKAQLKAMKVFDVMALPIDIDASPEGVMQRVFTQTWQTAEEYTHEANQALYGAYQNARQYGFIAKIGMWLEQIEEQQPDVFHKDMTIAVMLGSYHTAMIDKFEQFGADVHAPMTRDREDNTDKPEYIAFQQMTSEAMVSLQALQAATR